MDSILVIGEADIKLLAFMVRVGYRVFKESESNNLLEVVQKEVIDLILIDASDDRVAHDFCTFFRSTESTVDVPIVALCPDRLQELQIKELNLSNIEIMLQPYSLGTVASKIATLLRLRKMHGSEEWSTSVSEMNAALRDLNARFQKELEEARSIQLALLPKDLPSGDGFNISVKYDPLDGVGGDWYYIQRCPSGKILIIAADVTGHGLAAAFIGSMTKLALGAAGKETPSELLEEMNRLMAPHLPEGRFVTANSYLFDPKTGILEYARAGGPQAILFKRSTGEYVELLGDGFPIGFFEESVYSYESAFVDIGDILVVLTDGVTEAQNRDNKMFNVEGVVTALKAMPDSLSSSEILDRLYDSFQTFLDGRILKDDVTIIVLKKTSRN